MKLRGLDLVAIRGTDCDWTRFLSETSRWRSQGSKAALMKKAIAVEMDSMISRANIHRFVSGTHHPVAECFPIPSLPLPFLFTRVWEAQRYWKLYQSRHFRVPICVSDSTRWTVYIWLSELWHLLIESLFSMFVLSLYFDGFEFTCFNWVGFFASLVWANNLLQKMRWN